MCCLWKWWGWWIGLQVLIETSHIEGSYKSFKNYSQQDIIYFYLYYYIYYNLSTFLLSLKCKRRRFHVLLFNCFKLTPLFSSTNLTVCFTMKSSIVILIWSQGCISCGILVSGIRARRVSSEHMENMEMFSCSPT